MSSHVFALVALFGLLVASVFGLRPTTRPGVQCPTAPVQRLVVRDCCGRVVSRAPRPGDRVFVQCRCAEKKAASTKATVAQKITFLLSEAEPLVAFPSLGAGWVRLDYAPSMATWSSPPALRPPVVS